MHVSDLADIIST
jgi:hypothetical protein